MTQEEILQRIKDIMTDVFEIEAERITPEARLRDDLDIDSIDAVDLIVQLKPLVGRRMQPEAFKSVRTIGDVIDAIQALLVSGDEPATA
jgi:acyl carrier protein